MGKGPIHTWDEGPLQAAPGMNGKTQVGNHLVFRGLAPSKKDIIGSHWIEKLEGFPWFRILDSSCWSPSCSPLQKDRLPVMSLDCSGRAGSAGQPYRSRATRFPKKPWEGEEYEELEERKKERKKKKKKKRI